MLGNILIGDGVIVSAVRGRSAVPQIITSMWQPTHPHTPPQSLIPQLQGSVVLRPVPEFTRCSGVPAKVTSVLRQHQANLKVCMCV